MSEYIIGENIRIGNTFTDMTTEAVYDPTTISLSIYDPDGSLLETLTYAASEIIRSSTGIYYYDYKISGNPGFYISKWIAVISEFEDISENQFYVIAANNKLYVSIEDVKTSLMANSGITMQDETIQRQIRLAMSEVDVITGRSFLNSNTATEWFDVEPRNPNTNIDQIYLTSLPVQAITSLKTYNKGIAVTTYAADEFYLSDNFIVRLYNGSFPHGAHTVECIYTYGYEVVPLAISMLTSIITQIIIMREYMIGQDNAITGFSVPEIAQIQVGETYVSTERALAGLNKQKDLLIKEIGNLRNDIFIM